MTSLLHLRPEAPRGECQHGLDLISARAESMKAWLAGFSQREGDEVPSAVEQEHRMALYVREQTAIERRLEAELHARRVLVRPPTVLVAHHFAWLGTVLQAALVDRGLNVPGSPFDEAGLIGALVVGQPDVLLISEGFAAGAGLALVRRAVLLSPRTFIAVQVEADGNAQAALAAGAHAVLSRRASVTDLADVLERHAPRAA